MHIAFLGLGPMGRVIACRLAKKKFSITVWNRTPGAGLLPGRAGATVASSPVDAVRNADLVFTMLRDDYALSEVLLRGGVIDAMPGNSVHVALSTISVALAKKLLEEHRTRQQLYVSAPVFGGPPAAADGNLWTVAAGDGDTLAKLTPIFNAYSRGVTLTGDEPYQANAVKLAGNVMTLALTGALSEVTVSMEAAGVDPRLFHDVMDKGVFQSPTFNRFSNAMLYPKDTPGPFVWQGIQILQYFLNAAEKHGLRLPIVNTLLNDLEHISDAGLKDNGFASAYLALARSIAECGEIQECMKIQPSNAGAVT